MTNITIYYGDTDKKWTFPKFLIIHISPVMSHIIKENKDIRIDNLQFNEKDIEYLFNNLLLYPYFNPVYYKSFDDLVDNLNVTNISEIIKYYQMKNVLYFIHDLLNNTKIENLRLENFKSYFELKQFFKIDKLNLPFFNLNINNFLLKSIFDKELTLDNLDDETKNYLINFILYKIKKKPYYGYIIDLDDDFI